MSLVDHLSREAVRLNTRFETSKADSHEADLQILITATHDMYDLIRQLDNSPQSLIFVAANNTSDPHPFDQDRD